MGRYYQGDISGKFWFAVQPSNDVENLCNIKGTIDFNWIECGCIVENFNDTFCKNCCLL